MVFFKNTFLIIMIKKKPGINLAKKKNQTKKTKNKTKNPALI